MKGPSGRLRHPIRREWRCPVCDRVEYTGGEVVHRQCRCLAENDPPRLTWMMLIEPPRPVRAKKAEVLPETAPELPP